MSHRVISTLTLGVLRLCQDPRKRRFPRESLGLDEVGIWQDGQASESVTDAEEGILDHLSYCWVNPVLPADHFWRGLFKAHRMD